jgi:hypothetical protein
MRLDGWGAVALTLPGASAGVSSLVFRRCGAGAGRGPGTLEIERGPVDLELAGPLVAAVYRFETR